MRWTVIAGFTQRRPHVDLAKLEQFETESFDLLEDAEQCGLILDQTILENMTLAGLKSVSGRILTNRTRETIAAKGPMRSLRIKANSPMTVTGTLSGGNQQKVVLAKWLSMRPRVIIFDEPTRGVDVGSKSEIYEIMRELADAGVAHVAGEHRIAIAEHVARGDAVHQIPYRIACVDLPGPVPIAGVVGELHRVDRPDVGAETLQRKHRAGVADMTVGNPGLDRQDVHGH